MRQKVFLQAYNGTIVFERKRELYKAYVLQRTLDELASKKYTRLQASKKGQ